MESGGPLIQYDGVLIRRGDTQGECSPVNLEAETGVMHLQAKGC